MLIGESVNKNRAWYVFAGAYLVTTCVVSFMMIVPLLVPASVMAGSKSVWLFVLYQGCRILCAAASGRAAAGVDNLCCKYYTAPSIRIGGINIDLPFLGLLTGFVVSVVLQDAVVLKFMPH